MKELLANIGKTCLVNVKTSGTAKDSLDIECVIIDVRKNYGTVQYQVKPVSGKGEAWTEKITFS